jgi:hypothetical protein
LKMVVFCDKLFKVQGLFNQWADGKHFEQLRVYISLKGEDELVVVCLYEEVKKNV